MARPGAVITALFVCLAAGADIGQAQPSAPETRRFSTTVGALTTYPVFFHNHPVRVRGTLTASGGGVALTNEEISVLLVGASAAGLAPDDRPHEVHGVFVDPGRLSAGDPRLSGVDVEQLARERLNKDWPGVNELPLIITASVEAADPFPAPSVRALALTPNRYGDSQVTISGRFHARNLYGDQPDTPGRSQWDFVVTVADASVWVVGLRPRGTGFNFRVDSKIDTNQWVEVRGVVRQVRKLVVLEGLSITLAKPVDEGTVAPQTRVPTVGPAPEVVFSTPTANDTDVAPGARVRIQFSRDLNPASIAGQVRAIVLPASEPGSTVVQVPVPMKVTPIYDEGGRVLEVRFGEPLPPYAAVRIELLGGIRATDGAALAPWTLAFTLGE